MVQHRLESAPHRSCRCLSTIFSPRSCEQKDFSSHSRPFKNGVHGLQLLRFYRTTTLPIPRLQRRRRAASRKYQQRCANTAPSKWLDNSISEDLGDPGLGLPILQSLENPLDTNAFLSGSFDYSAFDASLSHGTDLTPLPATSASSPSQHLSMHPNGSVDSGIALDMDDPQGRRSSSEEKESMTPAQSRRKAQNRAA